MSIIWRKSYHKRSAAFHMVRLFANQSKILFLHNLFSGIRIHGTLGLQLTSLPPCWWTITKDSSLASIVSSTNMAATSLLFDSRGIGQELVVIVFFWDLFWRENCIPRFPLVCSQFFVTEDVLLSEYHKLFFWEYYWYYWSWVTWHVQSNKGTGCKNGTMHVWCQSSRARSI